MGMDVVFFRPRNVDMESERIAGKTMRDGGWHDVETRVPDIVDLSAYCMPRPENGFSDALDQKLTFLRKRAYLTKDLVSGSSTFLSKDTLPELLGDSEEFSDLALRGVHVKTPDALIEFIRAEGKTVVKPVFGSLGTGVHVVEYDRATDAFAVKFGQESQIFPTDVFRSYAEGHFFEKLHIVQRFFGSFDKAGNPIDCRIHLEKNGTNEWEPVWIYARIGFGQKVVSNIGQGGALSNIESFLKVNHPDRCEQINERLNDIASTLPYYLEAKTGRPLMTLGFDVGIAEDGSLCLYEINTEPQFAGIYFEVADTRAKYYRWLYEHVISEGEDPMPTKAGEYAMAARRLQ